MSVQILALLFYIGLPCVGYWFLRLFWGVPTNFNEAIGYMLMIASCALFVSHLLGLFRADRGYRYIAFLVLFAFGAAFLATVVNPQTAVFIVGVALPVLLWIIAIF